MRGWVYIIANAAMPGIIKVGYSMQDPEIRAKELNHTGTPHSYKVLYDILVDEPRFVEQSVHSKLSSLVEGKEWFRCSTGSAITAIRSVVGNKILLENIKNRTDIEHGYPACPNCEYPIEQTDVRCHQCGYDL